MSACCEQGMNFVAGCLLLFMDEEDAFWSLACIIEDLLPGYYSTAMVEPQVSQVVGKLPAYLPDVIPDLVVRAAFELPRVLPCCWLHKGEGAAHPRRHAMQCRGLAWKPARPDVHFLPGIALPETYHADARGSRLSGCMQVDQLVFRHLVDAGFPRLAGHLEALGAGVAGVSTQWFLCLFVNSLPLETCLRVWDLLFFERCSSVLFRVAMALVDIYAQAHPLLSAHHAGTASSLMP